MILPKVLRLSWLRGENFGTLEQHFESKKLKTFVKLSGKIYSDLVKVFYANLKFSNDILKSSVKGVDMEIKKHTEGCGWPKAKRYTSSQRRNYYNG